MANASKLTVSLEFSYARRQTPSQNHMRERFLRIHTKLTTLLRLCHKCMKTLSKSHLPATHPHSVLGQGLRRASLKREIVAEAVSIFSRNVTENGDYS